MTYTPRAGDRVIVRRQAGRSVVFVKTGVVLNVGNDGILHFKGDTGGTVYLATSAQLAPMGQTQTITPFVTANS